MYLSISPHISLPWLGSGSSSTRSRAISPPGQTTSTFDNGWLGLPTAERHWAAPVLGQIFPLGKLSFAQFHFSYFVRAVSAGRSVWRGKDLVILPGKHDDVGPKYMSSIREEIGHFRPITSPQTGEQKRKKKISPLPDEWMNM